MDVDDPRKNAKLRDTADKILGWIDRFKDVGDGFASLDPIHAGLPWAGIRLLLEATVSANREMAALISGLDIALYMMNRLKVYCEHFARLPKTFATSHFEEALTAFYALILQFLAMAIRKFETSIVGRSFEALFNANDVTAFEDECDKLGQRTEIDAHNCDRELAADLSNTLKDLKDEHIQIQTSIRVLQDKFDLGRLPVAEGAAFDSYDEQHEALCLEHTRVDLLKEIDQWVDDLDGKAIFWLQGMAGTGKSTISRTVARKLWDRQQLCASFFFKRGRGDRGGARRFFTSIAAQLARHDPLMGRYVADVLDETPELTRDKSLQEQFEKLVLNPLSRFSASPSQASSQTTVVIVVDALDECDPERDTQRILQLLGQLKAVIYLRLFVTSRPEVSVRLGFTELAANVHHDVILHDIKRTTIEHDIRLYFEDRFVGIRTERLKRYPRYPLPLDWPGEASISQLAETAVPLFIFAATACNFIGEPKADPEKRLAAVLSSPQGVSPSKFDYTYQPILNQLLIEGDVQEEQPLLDDFKELVGPIIVYFEPLSANSTASLLGIDIPRIERTLDWLHSVLRIPADPDTPIQLFHLSFRDFLLDPKKRDKSPFWIDKQAVHQILSERCLQLLSKSDRLKRNCLDLQKPGVRRDEIEKHVVEDKLPAEVSYACRYWVYHWQNANGSICDDDSVHNFLLVHFLHWMEALSWLGKLSNIVDQVSTLRSLVSNQTSEEVTKFLDDAKRFVLQNRGVVDKTPLQLYSSALIFAPEKSVIRGKFRFDRPPWLIALPKVPMNWDAELLELEGHEYSIECLACSSDGRLIASGSVDRTVRLWDSRTGEEVMTFSDHDDDVGSVSFSHGNQILAVVTFEAVTLWDLVTGSKMSEFKSSYYVHSVAFSPKSELLALACSNNTVLWDVPSRNVLWALSCHSANVQVVAFSPDGRLVATGSTDCNVVLIDCSMGKNLRVLSGHESAVNDVAFSSQDMLLVSASEDGVIILWDISTGAGLRKLEGHSSRVNAVCFTQDGKLLASGSNDGTVRLWDPFTGSEMCKFGNAEGNVSDVTFVPHSSLLASTLGTIVKIWDYSSLENVEIRDSGNTVTKLKVSDDNRIVASVSKDKAVVLWDTSSGTEVQRLDEHTGAISGVKFSPDSRLLASINADGIITMWELSTGGELWKCDPSPQSMVRHRITFSSDSRLLALDLRDTTIRLLTCSTGETVRSLECHSSVRDLTFSSDSRRIVAACEVESVRMWDIFTGKMLWERRVLESLVFRITFSPDNTLLAMRNGDRGWSLWDAHTGDVVRELSCYSRVITAAAFSSDSQRLASVHRDYKVRLWDCQSGAMLSSLSCRIDIQSICFSADDRHLKTEHGYIEVEKDRQGQLVDLSFGKGLFQDGEWIMDNAVDFLWLPYKYRGDSSASAGNVLVIGQRSGQVWFLGL